MTAIQPDVWWTIQTSNIHTAIDLNKQQVLDADLKLIKQINFSGNLGHDSITEVLFILEEVKKTILDFLCKGCESIIKKSFEFYLISI